MEGEIGNNIKLVVEENNMSYTNTFTKGLNHLQTMTKAHILFCILKIITIISIIFYSQYSGCGMSEIIYWMICVVIQCLIAILWCQQQIQVLQNNNAIMRIAEDLQQVVYGEQQEEPQQEEQLQGAHIELNNFIEINQTSEETRRIRIISQQIRSEINARNRLWRWIGYNSFLLNQLLLIWALIIEFSTPQLGPCTKTERGFVFAFILCCAYQYLEIYLVALLMIICIPFILIFYLISIIRDKKQNYLSKKAAEELIQKHTISYTPTSVVGDPECHICMSAYNLNEKIILLPCNELHHFHLDCASAWFKVQLTCPLCRKHFIE